MMLLARQRLRRRLRDLAAASSFLAIVLTGAAPIWAALVFGAAFLMSMFGVRPLSGRRTWSAVLLLATALGLFGAAFTGAMDLVISAVTFATLVTSQRMVSEPTSTTDNQVLLASLLLLAGGAALTGEVWFGACLFAFGAFSTLSLVLGVLEGPGARDESLPVSPALRQTGAGIGFAIIGAVAFFVLFPRLSWNVAARRQAPGLFGGTTGMSDRVKLGGGGTIKTSARAVLRATLTPDPPGDELDRYWLGRTFDRFDGVEWTGTGVPEPPRSQVSVSRADTIGFLQRIELLPAYDSLTLVALDRPVSFSSALAQSTSGAAPTRLVHVPGEEVRFALDANAYIYSATSSAARVELAADRPDARFLELPSGLDLRVAELAVRVGGDRGSPGQIARRLEKHLREQFDYTLELAGDQPDPLGHFLFDRRAGHCEHFATALAVLLRTRGIPSRVAAGFFGGERVGERWLVRAGDAHAWTQAWIEGEGWVTLDATPATGRRGQPPPALQVLAGLYEQLEEFWRSRVIDYSLQDQFNFARSLVRPPGASTGPGEPQAPPATALRIPSATWLAAVGLALVLAVLVRRRRHRRGPRPHAATGFREALEVALRQAKIARTEGEPLEELATRLAREGHPAAKPVARATRRYLEARFAARALGNQERAALLAAVTASPRAAVDR